jgi:F-type H+-transporting ATPase subunit gamma
VRREHELERRVRSLQALGEAIGAMKNLSARHYREIRGAVGPAREYRNGIERILAWTGAELPSGGGAAGLLVIGAELGLCGGYNVQVVSAGAQRRAALGDGPTVCAGTRAAALMRRRGIALARTYNAPTSAKGITEFLLRLAEDLLTTYVAEDLSSLDIVSTQFLGVGNHPPVGMRLLPLNRERSDHRPTIRYVSETSLTFAVIREYLYILLYDLLIDALAAEYSARLVATGAAGEWLDEREERVRKQLAATRREASTQEVIEIAAGTRIHRR